MPFSDDAQAIPCFMDRVGILLTVASLLGLGACPAEPLHVRVVGVHDGDTLTALTDDKTQLKVRLHGIHAHELGQPFGQASIMKDKNLPDPVGAADVVQKELDGLKNSIASRLPSKQALVIGKHSYFVYFDKVSQAVAAAECQKRGGYLARITEREEYVEFYKRLLFDKKKIQLWVDGTNANINGEWTTLDGVPLGPITWAAQQPDIRGGGADGLTFWLYQDKRLGWACGMNDAKESERHGYICEWDDVP